MRRKRRPIVGYHVFAKFAGRVGPVCVGRRKTWRAAKRLGNFYYDAPKFVGVAECYIRVERASSR